jgi:hypothetical protein
MSRPYRLIHQDGAEQIHRLTGRVEDTLCKLIEAGPEGLTTIEYPAPRTSDYVFKLRKRGFVIETLTESHDGPFPGHHGRYILRSKVERLSPDPVPRPSADHTAGMVAP